MADLWVWKSADEMVASSEEKRVGWLAQTMAALKVA
jgi:hypothetical protein